MKILIIACVTGLWLVSCPAYGSSLRLDDDSVMMDGLMIDESDQGSMESSGFSVGLPGLRDYEQERPVRSRPSQQQRSGFSTGMDNIVYAEVKQHLRRADSYMKQRQWAEAHESFRKAYELNKSSKIILKKTALSAALAGQFNTADIYFRLYCARVPEDIEFLNAWAAVLIMNSRLDEARGLLDQVLEQGPDVFTYFHMYIVRRKSSDDNDFDKSYWAGLNIPEYATLLYHLIHHKTFYINALGENEFTGILDETLNISVDQMDQVYDLIGELRFALKDELWSEVDRHCKLLQQAGVNVAGVQSKIALSLKEQGEISKAIKILEDILEQYPDKTSLWYSLATLHLEGQDYIAALESINQCLVGASSFIPGVFIKAIALAEIGKVDESKDIIDNLKALDPYQLRRLYDQNKEYVNRLS